MVTAVAIFIVTLVLVIWQPRGLGIGWSAAAGALVALAFGVVQLADVPVVWGLVWNATITFVAVIIVCLILDEAGFFEWAAMHVARWGGGQGRRLFNLIVILGAAISALFANDGAALTLTPIVFGMILALGFSARSAFALVIATGFISDTASLPFVVSNLVNIVIADYFAISFARYALVMVPVTIVSVGASLVVLRLFFRRDIPTDYDVAALANPGEVIKDPVTFRVGVGVLVALLVGYFAADPLGIPVSAVATAAALVLVSVAARRPTDEQTARIDVVRVVREAPWQVVLFSLGMYLVVYGLRNEGLTDLLGTGLAWVEQYGTTAAATGTGFAIAGMSSIMNNMPTTLIAALGIDSSGVVGASQELMAYAAVIGADLGPKITPIGSLATLLWLSVLDRRGMHVGWGTYFRIGIVLTIPVLLVTLLALAGWFTVLTWL